MMSSEIMTSEMPVAFWAFYITYLSIIYIIALGFGVVAYILTGKSLSAIARRRGIEKPWLAWVPVGSDWLLGCISDQYRYVSYNQERNARGKLLKMNIVLLSMTVVICIIVGVMAAMGVAGVSDEGILALALIVLLACYAMIPVAVVYSINYYKAFYDLVRSCDPDKSLVYLLVSIFASFPQPFFLYVCRNKDLGMPPRKEPESLSEAE